MHASGSWKDTKSDLWFETSIVYNQVGLKKTIICQNFLDYWYFSRYDSTVHNTVIILLPNMWPFLIKTLEPPFTIYQLDKGVDRIWLTGRVYDTITLLSKILCNLCIYWQPHAKLYFVITLLVLNKALLIRNINLLKTNFVPFSYFNYSERALQS